MSTIQILMNILNIQKGKISVYTEFSVMILLITRNENLNPLQECVGHFSDKEVLKSQDARVN